MSDGYWKDVARISKPCANGEDGITQEYWQLVQNNLLAGRSFIEDVIWFAMYPGEICVQQ